MYSLATFLKCTYNIESYRQLKTAMRYIQLEDNLFNCTKQNRDHNTLKNQRNLSTS